MDFQLFSAPIFHIIVANEVIATLYRCLCLHRTEFSSGGAGCLGVWQRQLLLWNILLALGCVHTNDTQLFGIPIG